MGQNELITMTKEEARRYGIVKDLLAAKIDGTEAAKVLGLSVRQTKRLKKSVARDGIKGIIHGNRGRTGNRQIDIKIAVRAKKRLHEAYHDFNPLLAQEHLRDDDRIDLSKETVRQIMIKEKLWQPRKKCNIKKHFWRERKDNYGEMEQFDGSYHNWFEGRNKAEIGLEQCLLLAVDDATGKPTRGEFAANEGVAAVFGFWKGYIESKGAPMAVYLDKFSTYKINHKNAVDNKDLMTQYERAMKQLNIRVIHANSPQAKGRVERMNGTFQRRLVKEMRLAKINTIAAANIFLEEVFIPKFNKQFAVVPKKAANLHRRLTGQQTTELSGIMAVQSERTINNDYTVRFRGNYYQLEEIQPTTVYKKSKVVIEEWLNGELKIRARDKYLNYFKLPERPKKEIDIKLSALTVKKTTGHVPPIGHPWRRQYIFKKQPILSVAN